MLFSVGKFTEVVADSDFFFFFFNSSCQRQSLQQCNDGRRKGHGEWMFFFFFFSESSHIITTIQLPGTPVLTDRMTEVFSHTDAISSYKLPKILSATTLLVGSVTLLCVLKRFSFIWWVKDLFSCRTLNTVRQTHPWHSKTSCLSDSFTIHSNIYVTACPC